MELLNDDSRIETNVNCYKTNFVNFDDLFPLKLRNNQLSCLSINIRSIRKNFNSFKSFLLFVRFRFMFIVITETWLNECIDRGFDLPGYNSLNTYRDGSGGGIKIYYHDSLSVKVVEQYSGILPTHEALTIKASIPLIGEIYLLGIYRPPNNSINAFNDFLNNTLNHFANKKCIILGDLNIDMLKNNIKANITDFSNILLSQNFTNFIDKPTYIDPQSGNLTTCLDHIWTNFSFNNLSFTFDEPFTDHLPCALISNKNTDYPKCKVKFRNFSKSNKDKFLTELPIFINELELPMDNINTATNLFINGLNKLINNYFPIKIKFISNKRFNMPWLNSNLIKCITKKHKLFRLFQYGRIPYTVFKSYSNCLNIVLKLSEKYYYKKKFVMNKGNSKGTWKYIDKLLGRNKESYPAAFNIENSEVSDDTKIANSFNDYFADIPYRVQNSLDNTQSNYLHLVKSNTNSFFFHPTTPTEVSEIINKLKNGDNIKDIPVKILKLASTQLSPTIAKLFNLSVELSVFPEILKVANIRPVFKAGSKSDIGNYRPISILPVLDKIFEKIIYKRLYSFFEKFNILSDNQFGFRNKKSTLHAALQLEKTILQAFKNNKYCIAVFIDFRKAFDTVFHLLFFQKLEKMGIRGDSLKYIKSYLQNRKQFTQFRTGISSTKFNNIGVPQGSCLGPLLFNIYTNDMHNLFSNITTTMFADDTVLSKCGDNLDTLIADLNIELNKLNDWCNFNKLALNSDKTKWMLFTNKSEPLHPPISINNNSIEKVDTFKYLGFTLDSKFNFRRHINIVSSKLSQLSGISYYMRRFLTLEAANSIYYSFTYSILNYGIALWGGILQNSNKSALQTSQNKVIRNLFRPHYPTLSTDELFSKCKLLNVKQIYAYQLAITMFKILHLNDMPFLLNEIHDLLLSHNYPTRGRSRLQTPFPRVNAIKFNFLYQAITNWNTIPEIIKSSNSLPIFKNKLKKFLLSSM